LIALEVQRQGNFLNCVSGREMLVLNVHKSQQRGLCPGHPEILPIVFSDASVCLQWQLFDTWNFLRRTGLARRDTESSVWRIHVFL